MMKLLMIFAVVIAVVGCKNASAPQPTQTASSTPAAAAKPTPSSNWQVQTDEANRLDGSVEQFLSTGDLKTGVVRIVLCYKNGKPCAGDSIPVYVKSPCFVEPSDSGYYNEYKRKVRMKFDDGQLVSETWGISDNHKSVFPKTPSFVSELGKHNKLLFEFGCDASDASVFEFNISGLQQALDQAGIKTEIKKAKG